MISTPTMNTTPIMCHHAETMLSPDVMRTLSMLISAARPRKIA
jgi:hypothetical protein